MQFVLLILLTLVVACGEDATSQEGLLRTATPGECVEPVGPWKFNYEEVDGDCDAEDFTEITNFSGSGSDDPEDLCGPGATYVEVSHDPNDQTCEVDVYRLCEYDDGSTVEMAGTFVVVDDTTIQGEFHFEVYDAIYGPCYAKLETTGHPL